MSTSSRTRSHGAPLILLYHRVAVDRTDPWGLCVAPAHFEEQLRVLAQRARVMTLAALEADIRAATLAPCSVAITFDDGYADNLWTAAALLDRYALPATVFVSSRYVEEEREYWWDELDRLLLEPGALPRTIDLQIGDVRQRLDFGIDAIHPVQAAAACARWRAYELAPPTGRHAAYLLLWEQLVHVAHDERRAVLEALAVQLGRTGTRRLDRRPLRLSELMLLGRSGQVEIGAHTATHPLLPSHPADVQRREIEEGKTFLERALDRPVTSFAYPHGGFTEETVRIVREAGFARACTARPGQHPTDTASSRLLLGRHVVPDLDGDAFVRWLEEDVRA